MQLKKIIKVFGWFSLLFSLTINSNAEVLDKVAAIVNDDIITYSELKDKTSLVIKNLSRQNISLPPKQVLEKQVLNKIILDQIQLQMAKQFAIEIDSTSVNQAVADLAKSDGSSLADYKQKIARENGMTFEEFREHVRIELLLAKLQQREIGNEIRIASADIEGFLNSAAGQDRSGTEYRLGHILILAPEVPTPESLRTAEAKAIAIVEELKQGKDFKQLATAKSAGMQALEGGDLGWRNISEIPTIFVKHVANMQVGEVAGPVQSASGFHIIKLQNKRVGKQEDYAELRVRQILIKPGANTSDQEAQTSLEEMRKQIAKGQDFAKLAEKKSEELNTAVKGGDLGWITEKSVLPQFWSHIEKLPLNTVAEPFKTDMGWHLVQVTGRRSLGGSNEALRNRAADILRERKFNEMLEVWLKKIRDAAKVEVLI